LVAKGPAPAKSELLKGTLDMLVLQTLTVRPLHGYAIAQQIEASSNEVLRTARPALVMIRLPKAVPPWGFRAVFRRTPRQLLGPPNANPSLDR